MENSDLYIAHPEAGSRTFHIFKAVDDRSLCGSYMLWRRDPRQCSEIADRTTWVKGQDCKACFRKAGLLQEPPDAPD